MADSRRTRILNGKRSEILKRLEKVKLNYKTKTNIFIKIYLFSINKK